MRLRDQVLFQKIATTLVSFDQTKHHLPGIQTPAALGTFVEQLLESIRRVRYISLLKTRNLDEQSTDPSNDLFDPVKAAIIQHRNGNIDEAFWLTFLMTHFGKHRIAEWYYVRSVYGCLGLGRWDWINVTNNLNQFIEWLQNNKDIIKSNNTPNGFGNHRKYESLDAYSPNGTGAAIKSYLAWIGSNQSHQDLINKAYQQTDGNPKSIFGFLFNEMKVVTRFGRTARFDYLTTVGNIGLANVEPGFLYLQNSTGPIMGARLLFSGDKYAGIKSAVLETKLTELDANLKVGMQVLEDALCNWQKNPYVFKKFRG